MPAPDAFPWRFIDAVAVRQDRAFFAACHEAGEASDAAVSGVLSWDGDWTRKAFDLQAVSLCLLTESERALLLLGRDGQVACWGSDGFSSERIESGEMPLILRDVRSIAGQAYAVGMGRRVFRRDGAASWRAIDRDLRADLALDTESGLNSIDGFAPDDLYAVGWQGEVWHHDGATWQRRNSPVALALNKVICAPDGLVYIVGQAGLILQGRADHWRVIDNDLTRRTFTSACWFNGHLYVLSSHGLFRLEGERLRAMQAVPHLDTQQGRLSALSASEQAMWLISDRMAVVTVDGLTWREVTYP